MRKLVAASLLLVLVLAAAVWGVKHLREVFSPEGQLAWARSQWKANGYDHYVLEVAQNPFPNGATVRTEVMQERIVSGGDSVGNTPATVSELFDFIQKTLNNPECGVNGCECDGYWVPVVEYHKDLGYPFEIQFELSGPEPLRSSNSTVMRQCTLVASFRHPIRVTELTPLD